MSICQQRAKHSPGAASAGSLAERNHLLTLVPDAATTAAWEEAKFGFLLQHKAGVCRWLSAGHQLFFKSSARLNFQGGEAWPEKPGHHLRVSVHIREEQPFDCVIFFYPVVAVTVLCRVISAGRAACGKGKLKDNPEEFKSRQCYSMKYLLHPAALLILD